MFTFSIILLLFTTIDLNHFLFKTEYFSPVVGFLFEVFCIFTETTSFFFRSIAGWMDGLTFLLHHFSTDGNRIRFFGFCFFSFIFFLVFFSFYFGVVFRHSAIFSFIAFSFFTAKFFSNKKITKNSSTFNTENENDAE